MLAEQSSDLKSYFVSPVGVIKFSEHWFPYMQNKECTSLSTF